MIAGGYDKFRSCPRRRETVMSDADIVLDGNVVFVDGDAAEFRVTDLKIDSPVRRKNPDGWRRALVHNEDDGLTINFASDYPDGVTIEGKAKLDRIVANRATLQELRLDRRIHSDDGGWRMPPAEPAHLPGFGRVQLPDVFDTPGSGVPTPIEVVGQHVNRRALQHDPGDGLTINVDSDYPGGVTINGDVMLPGRLIVNGQDIAATMLAYEERISRLEARVLGS